MDTVIKTGNPAPDFTLPDLDGRPHSLSDYRGKVVVLNFWSAECPWAKRADELIQPMLAEWGDDAVLLAIGSNANETHEELAKAAAKRNIPIVLHDSEQVAAKLYGAKTTPHIFLIDQEGILRYQGAFDDVTFRQPDPTRNFLWEAMQAVLEGERPTLPETPSYGCTVVYHKG